MMHISFFFATIRTAIHKAFYKAMNSFKSAWLLDTTVPSLPQILRLAGAIVVSSCFFFVGLSLVFPLRVEISYSQIITDRDGTVLQAFLSDDDKWRMKTELHELSPTLITALVNKEDRLFYWHGGINPIAVVRAAWNNLTQQKITSGASTITMQVARMLENQRRTAQKSGKERTFANKLVEMFRALQLEARFSKREILQLYMNLAPYGGNIEGVKAASLLYFGQAPEKLSLAQATTLAIIPNRPTSLRLDASNTAIRGERDKWLQRFVREGVFSDAEVRDALLEPTDIQHRRDVPNFAPHLGYRLRKLYPHEPIISSTLRLATQQNVQMLTQNVVRRLKLRGINNAAVLVINNHTHSVEAYLGSADYDDKLHAGEVDGIQAVRSPGSALKPLVYGIAMDKGMITPKTVLADVPMNFDGYAPENFNRTFNGLVTAERALVNSLNMPAVQLLNQTSVATFVEKLKLAGFEQIRKDERKLGLSSVLGGCGVRLEELAGLYCAFASEGVWKPLQYVHLSDSAEQSVVHNIRQFFSAQFAILLSKFSRTPAQSSPDERRIISPSAAFMLGEILTQLTRPDVPHKFTSTQRLPKVAWKTGTSYGRRDAWSVGYNKRYTIAVWVGNFSGAGVPELVGAEIATPLLFDIFNALDYNSPNDWFAPPPELDFRLVCSESGLPPNEFCENQVNDYYLPSVSTNEKCRHLKAVMVSADEHTAYCTDCVPQTGFKTKFYPNFSPDIMALYTAQNRAFERIPEHNPQCSRIFSSVPPAITSLVDGKEYLVERETNGKTASELMLACTAANDVRKVYWFVNDKLLRAAAPTERVFFTPQAGRLKISCSDDKGKTGHIVVHIRYQ